MVSLSLKYFRCTLLVSLLLTASCINTESNFSIDKLPNATEGQFYSVVIKIWGGVMHKKETIAWEITPEDSGIEIKPTTEGWYNEIEIYGTPKTQGDISIHLKGGGYGTPPYHFDKTFILKVNPK